MDRIEAQSYNVLFWRFDEWSRSYVLAYIHYMHMGNLSQFFSSVCWLLNRMQTRLFRGSREPARVKRDVPLCELTSVCMDCGGAGAGGGVSRGAG